MVDFQTNKITVHTGINDVPIAPSDSTGSNISHVHDEHNKLIDNLIVKFNEIQGLIDTINTSLAAVNNSVSSIENSISNLGDSINDNSTAIANLSTNSSNADNTLRDRITQTENDIAQLESELILGQATEFTFDGVVFNQIGSNYEYQIVIPKNGDLTEIAFNDSNSLSDITITYLQATVATNQNIGSDPNYPYVLNPLSNFNVTLGDSLIISTPVLDPVITSIKLTII